MRLLVDLGGTNCRCALATEDGKNILQKDFINKDYSSLIDILTEFDQYSDQHAESAALSIAAPMFNDPVEMTNLPWIISTSKIRKALAISKVYLLNDFAAVAMSLPSLNDSQLCKVKAGQQHARAPKTLLGPGTGLGVGGLLFAGNHWHPIEGEGGHVTQAGMTEWQHAVLDRLYTQFDHVSAEKVNSGMGLENLYRAVEEIEEVDSPSQLSALEITTKALANDRLARSALDLFYDFLAINAGNLVLAFGAKGGVYLAGGILPKICRDLLDSTFVEQFLQKGRFQPYLQEIPIYLVVEPYPAFIGLNNFLNNR